MCQICVSSILKIPHDKFGAKTRDQKRGKKVRGVDLETKKKMAEAVERLKKKGRLGVIKLLSFKGLEHFWDA